MDVEELLARFQQTDSVRYEAFSAIWREMGFSDVYHGMPCLSEMKRFCRVTLATAVKYFLPPYSYQIRVGGLYLMYGLYHTQLAIPPVHIRIALKDWSHVEKFLQDSNYSRHYDVVYIYKKLVAKKAIHYTAMPHFLYFRKRQTPTREVMCAEFVGRSAVIQDLLSADIVEEMANIQILYEKMKAATPDVRAKASMTRPDIVTNLKDSMSEFIVWQNQTFSQKDKERDEKEVMREELEHPSSRAKLLSSIKQKSYSSVQGASKGRRHRLVEVVSDCNSGVEDVQTSTSFKRTSSKKRPVSLFRRTQDKLGVAQDMKPFNKWLLTIPESFPGGRGQPPTHLVP
uniref:snRNA-activating protein complex subunit 1 n=1 Tax=Neogobius melanostomus TaxID=47308 RepID=A0A8C6SJI5_9GOBI